IDAYGESVMVFDPVRDVGPISAGASVIILVAVHAGVPARSLTELAHLAQSEPGKLLWGAGPGLITDAEIDFVVTPLESPDFAVFSPVMFTAWGRRPQTPT